MDKSSSKSKPEVKPPLAKNKGYQARKNDFNYRSVIGSLNFLPHSTLPEEKFAAHQCAQISANTKLPHNQAVKHVLKYLKGTPDNRIIMKPYPEQVIECYLDSDLTGGWNQEEGRDPGLVLSRIGYIIIYADCPIIWAGRLHI